MAALISDLFKAFSPQNQTQVGIDPMLGQYLQSITGGNMARMGAEYQNLGLGPDPQMGMSPQESKDIAWTGEQGDLTGTILAQQETPTLLAANQLNMNQLAQQVGQIGQLGQAAGGLSGLAKAIG
jgi:hypothetical protein